MTSGRVFAEVTIVNRRGLHARAAAKFVKTAAGFDAEVTVAKDDMCVIGVSILGLMMLGAGTGTVLRLEGTGPQAEAAVAGLRALVARGFDED